MPRWDAVGTLIGEGPATVYLPEGCAGKSLRENQGTR